MNFVKLKILNQSVIWKVVHKFVKDTKIFPKSSHKVRRKIFLLAWYNSVYKNLAFTK